MKCLVFDIWGDFAHFRKFYTTSSPLTFSFPPRTAIAGMIAAIVGLDKEEYLQYFKKDNANIAVELRNPVKKTRISYNLIDTKTAKLTGKIQNRTQVTFEVLKDSKFRIYFNHTDEKLYSKIEQNLEQHKCYYTLCMGISEYISNFEYIGEIEYFHKHSEEVVSINTVIPFKEKLIKINFEDGKEYFKDTLPNEMSEDREVTEYVKVIYERNCKPINCNIGDYYISQGGENIVFL